MDIFSEEKFDKTHKDAHKMLPRACQGVKEANFIQKITKSYPIWSHFLYVAEGNILD